MVPSRQHSTVRPCTHRRRRPRKGDTHDRLQSTWDPAVGEPSASEGPSTGDEPSDCEGGGAEAGAAREPACTSLPPPAEQAEQAEREAAPQRGFVSRLASAVQKGRSLGWLPVS